MHGNDIGTAIVDPAVNPRQDLGQGYEGLQGRPYSHESTVYAKDSFLGDHGDLCERKRPTVVVPSVSLCLRERNDQDGAPDAYGGGDAGERSTHPVSLHHSLITGLLAAPTSLTDFSSGPIIQSDLSEISGVLPLLDTVYLKGVPPL